MSDQNQMLQELTNITSFSALQDLPDGQIIANLRLKLGDKRFIEIGPDLWEMALDSLYYNVNDEIRNTLTQLSQKQDWEQLNNYLAYILTQEPSLLIVLGKGANLAARVIAKENKIKL